MTVVPNEREHRHTRGQSCVTAEPEGDEMRLLALREGRAIWRAGQVFQAN